ncbi:phenylalanine--tRNA ligase subunit beta [Fervidobacterium thailandense]|uniref:Phenylalanine--tRNA ligase beta subunit n=1 Tax=Fervidobacterium thailandense TaxID=1008305 RepID=A0A1E3G4X1_9BACT|nr:phenylalanine--tRNA ligase subunit beta [Fervidobacterium thailandense]ODN31341.1 phenylalanine--tRNA ligase subunit beta [Fervidobacterium thailandense]
MRLSLEWLNDYIDVTKDEILEKLPKLGVDIDDQGFVSPVHGPIVIGFIESTERHPNADKLLVCKVNIGNEVKTVLTADTSVQEGTYVLVALPGAKLANGVEIAQREMRGIVSEGMLCSLEELGLAEKSEHVFTTTEQLPVGEDAVKVLKLDDWFFETDITPNRGDCLSYFGIARELAAGLKRTARYPVPKAQTYGEDYVPVEIQTEGCWRYTCRVIRNVKVGESPFWLKRRLIASGLRPINNIVDITNYVMLETGHPVHAFDLRKLSGKIVVREARPGERMLLLDGKEYTFSGGEVLITDGEKALALGGIMGGEESGISDDTTDVLLEVAMFDPVVIRRTSRRLGVSSDSSYRFERGVNFEDNLYVIERLSELIEQLAGGQASKTVIDEYPYRREQKVIFVPKELPKKVLGVEIRHIGEYIEPLGFEVEEVKEGYYVYVPAHRYFDMSIPEDIIEEVGRIHGYDHMHSEPPRLPAIEKGRDERQKLRYEVKRTLAGLGFNEANNLSFVSSKTVEVLNFVGHGVPIQNPIVADFDELRPSLLYGLLESLSYNYKRQNRDVKLFELGKVFSVVDGKPCEREALGIVMTGREAPRDYTDKRPVSFHSLKGVVEELLEKFNVQVTYKQGSVPGFLPSRCAQIVHKDMVIGYFGMLDPEIADRIYDVKDEIYLGEIYLEALYEVGTRKREYRPIPMYPFIRRDVSYLIPVGFEISKVLEVYKTNPLVEEVGVDDIYRISDEVYSVTVYAKFRSSDRTLSDEEVDLAIADIKKRIAELHGIKPRFEE